MPTPENGVGMRVENYPDGFATVIEMFYDGKLVEAKEKRGFKTEREAEIEGSKMIDEIVAFLQNTPEIRNLRVFKCEDLAQDIPIQ